jgi:hypothetical protein
MDQYHEGGNAGWAHQSKEFNMTKDFFKKGGGAEDLSE